jgi:succinate-semialdehyde dehydrogenase / glutarate-semialdehyde dehydrogenase
MAQCAGTVKKISLELGGNAPFIVFDDADLDAAVEGAMPPSTATPARPASAPTASYVQDGVYDEFAEAPRRGGRSALKVGDGLAGPPTSRAR